MSRILLTVVAAAATMLTADLASAQFVPGECNGTGQKKMQGKRGGGNGKRTGPRDGSGPQHDPQGGGQGRRGGRR